MENKKSGLEDLINKVQDMQPLTEAEKQRLSIKELPPGMDIKGFNELKEISQPGTFWDYCPDLFIDIIGFGLALISTAIGFGLWKYVINKNFG